MEFLLGFLHRTTRAPAKRRNLHAVICVVLLEIIFCDLGLTKPLQKGTNNAGDMTHPTDASVEDCDWTGMTKPSILATGSVQQEYIRCAKGRIKWLYPEGAVRITINSPSQFLRPVQIPPKSTSPQKSYRVCLSIDLTTLKNVNIYLQEKGKLSLIFSPSRKPVDSGTHRQPSLIPSSAVKIDRKDGTFERKCLIQAESVATVYLESFLVEGLNFISASSVDSSSDGQSTGRKIYTRLPSTGTADIHYDIRAV